MADKELELNVDSSQVPIQTVQITAAAQPQLPPLQVVDMMNMFANMMNALFSFINNFMYYLMYIQMFGIGLKLVMMVLKMVLGEAKVGLSIEA